MTTVLLLIVANVFMTFAWYGHLRHRTLPLVTAADGGRGVRRLPPSGKDGNAPAAVAGHRGIEDMID